MTIRREPTVIIQAISVLLTILVSFRLDFLSADQSTLIIAVITAGLSAFNAFKTRPVAPAAIIGLFTAGTALLTGYGLNLSQELVGSLTAAVPVLLTLLVRGQVTPADDPGNPQDVVG
jgi:hypothetical protein